MRRTRALPLVAILTLLAACGGGGGGGDDGDGDDGGGTTQSEPAEATPEDGGGDGGGGDDGSTGSFDLDRAFEILTPPSGTELSKTTAEGIIFAAWDSDDDFDSLRSFYEDAIDEAGFEVITTTEAQGGIAWVVGLDDGSGVGGSISLFPASDGSGTQISVTIGEEG
jgi:hypothetical protein